MFYKIAQKYFIYKIENKTDIAAQNYWLTF